MGKAAGATLFLLHARTDYSASSAVLSHGDTMEALTGT